MTRSARLAGAVVLILFLVGSACAKIPENHHYLLRLSRTEEPEGRRGSNPNPGLVVGIPPFEVDSPFDQSRIVYRVGESLEMGFYSYHRWAVPLSRMLPNLVAQSLRGAAGIAQVEPLVSGRDYDAILTGHLITLEEIDSRDGQQVHLDLVLSLRKGKGGSLIWSKRLNSRKMTEQKEISAVVEQMAKALETVLTEARPGLASALERLEEGSD